MKTKCPCHKKNAAKAQNMKLIVKKVLFTQECIDLGCSLSATGQSTNYKGGTIGGITADEDVLRVLRVFGLEEAHSQENKFGLDDFRFALLNHDGTTTVGIGFPVNLLNLYTCEVTIFADEFEGIDIPTTCAAFFMTRCSLQGARPLRPWDPQRA